MAYYLQENMVIFVLLLVLLMQCSNFSNEILPEEDDRYSILTDGTLMITETQDLDEGVYECMAKNPAGEIKSRAAKMHYLKGREIKNKGKYFNFFI